MVVYLEIGIRENLVNQLAIVHFENHLGLNSIIFK